MRLFTILTIAMIGSAPCAAQATEVSEPRNDYLLKITQDWGRNSALGDLKAAKMGSEDLELRFWSGYGGGTRALIIRRSNGQWDAWRAVVVSCSFYLPISVADTLSPTTTRSYQARALANCAPLPAPHGPLRLLDADSVALIRIEQIDMPVLWATLVRAGIDSLPPAAPRPVISLDGHGYVVELRRGDSYRASKIHAYALPGVRADSMVQRLARLVEPYSWPR